MRRFLVLLAVSIYCTSINSQNIGVGVPNPQNKLHVGGGFRLDTLTGVNGAGLLRHDANGAVYGIKFSANANDVLRGDGTFGPYNPAINGALGWLLVGNSGTNPATHFVGTTDNQPLIFRVNNFKYGYLGNNNIFFGSNAGMQTTGGNNIGIGTGALKSNIIGFGSVAIGDSALANTTSGTNVAIGYRSLMKTNSSENVAIGYEAMTNLVSGGSNTAMGYHALRTNTTGFWNTAVGRAALALNNGEQNTAIGFQSLFKNSVGGANSALGTNALTNNTNGYFNTAVGADAAFVNSSGHDLTAIGAKSMYGHYGNFNTAMGAFSMYNGNGNYNTVVGYKALEQNGGSCCNVAIGQGAMQSNGIGSYNTVVGLEAMLANTTGQANTVLGLRALSANKSGEDNVALGYYAMWSNTVGNNNTSIGSGAGGSLPSGITNAICLGYGTGWNTTSSNHANIGNFSMSWIGGQVGWFHYSDKRIKNDIREDVPGLSFIKRLKPITYHVDIKKQEEIANTGIKLDPALGKELGKDWEGKYDVEKIKMSGFFAQDVEEAAKEINYSFNGVHNPKTGGLYSLDYSAFVVPLVKAVQEQQTLIEDQNKKIDRQQQQIDLLIKEMNRLKTDLVTRNN